MDKRRFDSLERFIRQYSDQAEAEMRCFNPYAVFHPWQFLEDEYSIEFWKNGFQHGKAEEIKGTWDNMVAFIMELPPETDVDMMFCDSLEWLVCYHLFADRKFISWNGKRRDRPKYTDEQVKAYKEQAEMENHRIACLWNGSTAGETLRNILATMPERILISAEDLQKEIMKG